MQIIWEFNRQFTKRGRRWIMRDLYVNASLPIKVCISSWWGITPDWCFYDGRDYKLARARSAWRNMGHQRPGFPLVVSRSWLMSGWRSVFFMPYGYYHRLQGTLNCHTASGIPASCVGWLKIFNKIYTHIRMLWKQPLILPLCMMSQELNTSALARVKGRPIIGWELRAVGRFYDWPCVVYARFLSSVDWLKIFNKIHIHISVL